MPDTTPITTAITRLSPQARGSNDDDVDAQRAEDAKIKAQASKAEELYESRLLRKYSNPRRDALYGSLGAATSGRTLSHDDPAYREIVSGMRGDLSKCRLALESARMSKTGLNETASFCKFYVILKWLEIWLFESRERNCRRKSEWL
jgi:hypothetical protein